MKLIVTIIAISMMFNTKGYSQIDDEIKKIFNNYPLEKGVKKIIEESDIEFEYWKIPISPKEGSYTESWQTKLMTHCYLNNHNGEINLRINKGIGDCYDTTILLSYDSVDLMEQDYEIIKSKFIKKNTEIREDPSIIGDLRFGYFKYALIDCGKRGKVSVFLSYGNPENGFPGYQIALIYESC